MIKTFKTIKDLSVSYNECECVTVEIKFKEFVNYMLL